MAWFTLEDLGALLPRQRADDTVSSAITPIFGAKHVVRDVGVGLVPATCDAAEGPYHLVDAALMGAHAGTAFVGTKGHLR